jgi:hypothetical protein
LRFESGLTFTLSRSSSTSSSPSLVLTSSVACAGKCAARLRALIASTRSGDHSENWDLPLIASPQPVHQAGEYQRQPTRPGEEQQNEQRVELLADHRGISFTMKS